MIRSPLDLLFEVSSSDLRAGCETFLISQLFRADVFVRPCCQLCSEAIAAHLRPSKLCVQGPNRVLPAMAMQMPKRGDEMFFLKSFPCLLFRIYGWLFFFFLAFLLNRKLTRCALGVPSALLQGCSFSSPMFCFFSLLCLQFSASLTPT